MTAPAYSVKQLNELVASGAWTHEQAIAHCDIVLARPKTQADANKTARWTRVRGDFVAGKTADIKAAFASMPAAQAAAAAKPAKPAPAKAEPQPKADPLTVLTQRMAAQDQRIDALVAAFTSLVERMPKPRTKKAA